MITDERKKLCAQVIAFIVEADRRVTSDEVRDKFHVRETTSGNYNTRKLIKDAMEYVGDFCAIPIGADRHGYFVIKSKEEYDAYVDNLTQRVAGIQKRIQLVKAAWRGK
jgi:hypothetical protein